MPPHSTDHSFVALEVRGSHGKLCADEINLLCAGTRGVKQFRVDIPRRKLHLLFDGCTQALEAVVDGLGGLGYEVHMPEVYEGEAGHPAGLGAKAGTHAQERALRLKASDIPPAAVMHPSR